MVWEAELLRLTDIEKVIDTEEWINKIKILMRYSNSVDRNQLIVGGGGLVLYPQSLYSCVNAGVCALG